MTVVFVHFVDERRKGKINEKKVNELEDFDPLGDTSTSKPILAEESLSVKNRRTGEA